MDRTAMRSRWTRNGKMLATVLPALTCMLLTSIIHGAERHEVPIKVLAPQYLPGDNIVAVRSPLGIPNDYKPWIARLPDGQLLIVAFSYGGVPNNLIPPGTPYLERAVFWRSDDDGQTWGPRDEQPDVHGREFALNVLGDGTLIMPCHFLSADAANKAGHTYSKVFRSADQGHTWTETRIGPDGFPKGANTTSDWTVVEMPDPDMPESTCAMLGVSMQHGGTHASRHVYWWKSTNSGLDWKVARQPDTDGWSDVDGFFSQSVTHRTSNGDLLHVVRVDRTGPHWRMKGIDGEIVEVGDQGDRMMLWRSTDAGRTFRRQAGHGNFGSYGEMYPRFLKLNDGRLLLTFTVRSNSSDGHALGLRAICSYDDGATWDFRHDRIVIDYQNVGASGGGFGNTVQVDDGSLVSCYSYRGPDDKTHIEAVRWRLPTANRQ